MQAVGGLTGASGGAAGSNGAAAAAALPQAERARIEEAIEAAFTTGSGGDQQGVVQVGRRRGRSDGRLDCSLRANIPLAHPWLHTHDCTPMTLTLLLHRPAADDAFELLLEVTGAAGAEDMAAGAPGVNVQHSGGCCACFGL